MKVYNLYKPREDGDWKNLNLLPFISFYYDKYFCYLNIGWLYYCIQFKIK